MDRLACVELPALPLQLLLRRHAEWARRPAAVIDKDQPQGKLLWVNEPALKAGVLPGQTYSAALSLCGELRAAEIATAEIEAAVAEATETLRRFTPDVEPSADPTEAGIFWLNAAGLLRLYPSLTAWGHALLLSLTADGLYARVAIGFHRFGVYAAVKSQSQSQSRQRVVVFTNEADERQKVARTPLMRIGLLPSTQKLLAQLAVHTVGDFLALPPGGIRRRFGVEAYRLHQLGHGAWAPLTPAPVVPDDERVVELDDAESDVESLTFFIKQALDPLLVELRARSQTVAEVVVTLRCERGAAVLVETIKPAEPTLDGVQLLGLVRLRLESLQLGSGVIRITVPVTAAAATAEQLRLLTSKPRRDLRAAARAIARLRAALGDKAVVRAQLREAHLPEARFTWELFEPDLLEKEPRAAAGDFARSLFDASISRFPCPSGRRASPTAGSSTASPAARWFMRRARI